MKAVMREEPRGPPVETKSKERTLTCTRAGWPDGRTGGGESKSEAGRRDIDHASTLHLQVHCPELLAATRGGSWGSLALEVGRLWQVSTVISLALFSGRDEQGGGAETLSTPTQLAPGVGDSWGAQRRPALLQGPPPLRGAARLPLAATAD